MSEKISERTGQAFAQLPPPKPAGRFEMRIIVVREVPEPTGVTIMVQNVKKSADYNTTRLLEPSGNVVEHQVIDGAIGLLFEPFVWPEAAPLELDTPYLPMFVVLDDWKVFPWPFGLYHQKVPAQIPAGSCQDAPTP